MEAAASVVQMTGGGGRVGMNTDMFLLPSHGPFTSPPGVIITTGSPNTGVHQYAAATLTLLRRDAWVLPVLILSVLTMTLIMTFEVFVLCKTRKTEPSRRHLFLGQALLGGLFVCAAVSGLMCTQPTVLTCATVRLCTGLGYSMVFGTLLVKCVFLISLNGGVYLPAPYQALLLFFTVAIQLAIGVQWLIYTPPQLLSSQWTSSLDNSCDTKYQHMLGSLVYAAGLLLAVTVLAIKSRHIRDNYREAMYIGLAVGCTAPLCVGWAVAGLWATQPGDQDGCLALGLGATAALVLLVMFMPKGRQLAAMGRDGLYDEDKLSTLSRPASPSFFHFKPFMTPMKHTSTINTFGDRVALVAPPTYAHHYYPYCYYPHHGLGGGGGGGGGGLIGGGGGHHGGHMQQPIYSRCPPDMCNFSGMDNSIYTTMEPTMSNNPNVFFHRSGIHPGMMY
ncbi:unnamed protein product [Macrosiphum euphorbiae]|uniref:G-protein coupled receptors family 3 profile domain-containing protein n=1 Tax=Macrosiphum euphorbiae TaxID=13131 RepID=A0AAV0VUK7_9HEMI|nr:unnamed protein product [Macrosiphum euphorbiae]